MPNLGVRRNSFFLPNTASNTATVLLTDMPDEKNIRKKNCLAFSRHLYRALGPAELLALCSVHLHREFGIHFDSFQKEALPALHLCPVAEVKVFDKCGGMPAAGVIDA